MPHKPAWAFSAGALCFVAGLALTGCAGGAMPDRVAPLRSEPIPRIQTPQASDRFGALFCATLNHLPDAARWGYCARYIDPAGSPSQLAGVIPTTYRVVVVPGIFGQCVESLARPWEDARRHLWSEHHVDVEYIPVSAVGGASYNAQTIIQYLARQFTGTDDRRYVAFGYSKGASDILQAIHESAATAQRIAAVVTVAGSVLGSRLTDRVPRDLLRFLQSQRLGTCDVGDGKGLDDLHRKERVDAMREFRTPPNLKIYSIAAVSTLETTSKILQSGWQQLSGMSREQDSQMLHEDAIVPGADYLGMALGDHWAVALPFETATTSDSGVKEVIRRLIDQNHYPRAALFEAALRHVLLDLGAPMPSR